MISTVLRCLHSIAATHPRPDTEAITITRRHVTGIVETDRLIVPQESFVRLSRPQIAQTRTWTIAIAALFRPLRDERSEPLVVQIDRASGCNILFEGRWTSLSPQ